MIHLKITKFLVEKCNVNIWTKTQNDEAIYGKRNKTPYEMAIYSHQNSETYKYIEGIKNMMS